MNRQSCTDMEQTPQASKTRPRVDTYEDQDLYLLVVELPGVAKEDLEVSLENELLTVRGERRLEESMEARQGLAEFGPTVYERSFRLGDGIDQEGIEASLEHGLLRLTFPKRQPERKSIPIRSN